MLLAAAQLGNPKHEPPPPTVEERYAGLKFDPNLYEPATGIICYSGSIASDRQTVEVQFGERCVASPAASVSADTYDNLHTGQSVKVKMATDGTWWTRPVEVKSW